MNGASVRLCCVSWPGLSLPDCLRINEFGKLPTSSKTYGRHCLIRNLVTQYFLPNSIFALPKENLRLAGLISLHTLRSKTPTCSSRRTRRLSLTCQPDHSVHIPWTGMLHFSLATPPACSCPNRPAWPWMLHVQTDGCRHRQGFKPKLDNSFSYTQESTIAI